MAAGIYDFTVEQGATLDQKLLWKDQNGTLVSLTGFTARMQIRPTISSSTILFEFTTASGGIVLGPGTGEIHITATATETSGWTGWPIATGKTLATAIYDLEMVSGTGVVTRLLKGTISLDPEVTR